MKVFECFMLLFGVITTVGVLLLGGVILYQAFIVTSTLYKIIYIVTSLLIYTEAIFVFLLSSEIWKDL